MSYSRVLRSARSRQARAVSAASILRAFIAFVLVVGLCPTPGFAEARDAQGEAPATLQESHDAVDRSTEESIKAESQTLGESAEAEERSATEAYGVDAEAEGPAPLEVGQSGGGIDTAISSIGIADQPEIASVGATQGSDLHYEYIKLNLIQAGDDPNVAPETPDVPSVGASVPADQMQTLLARMSNAMMNVQEEANIYDLRISKRHLSEVVEAVQDMVNTNPDLFYVSNGMRWSWVYIQDDEGVYEPVLHSIAPSYAYDTSSIPGMKTQYESAMQDVLSWVPVGESDVEKAKAVHDWLVRNCAYNTSALSAGSPEAYGSYDPWTAYGALVGKSPVCQGYSLAFSSVMARLGIKSTYVSQQVGSYGHGWNRALLDGSWYNIDVTHDDPLPDRGYYGSVSSEYFGKSDAWWKENPSDGSSGVAWHTFWSPEGIPATNTQYDARTSWTTYGPSQSTASGVSNFELSKDTLSMGIDEFGDLSIATIEPASANRWMATWSSSDTSVATVHNGGVVSSAHTAGATTVTVSLGGISRTCKVYVKGGYIGGDGVTPSLAPARFDYAGKPLKPRIRLVHKTPTGDIPLTEGEDYRVSWPSDVTSAGSKDVTITGIGRYSGEATVEYEITPIDINKCSFSTAVNKAYTGSAQKSPVTVTLNDKTLTEGVDYSLSWPKDVTNVGKKTVTIKGKGNFTGSHTYSYEVTPASLSSATVSRIGSQTYTGKALKPAVTVTAFGKTLKQGTDFDITWSNNTAVGTARLKIVGKGNYTGTLERQFSIAQAQISKASMSIADQIFTGSAITPKLSSATFNGVTLKEGADYKITGYAANVNVGTATATIDGMGNFTGTHTVSFAITPIPISKASMAAANRTFTGLPLKPGLSKATFDGVALKQGTDYKIAGYKANTNVGTATITVAGMGDFAGTRTVTFKITPAQLSTDFFTMPLTTYTGKSLTPAPSSAMYGKVSLTKETDFTMAYANNLNAGTAFATITGKGNYTGSVDVSFKINKAQVSKASMAIADQTYTGKALTPKLKTAVFGTVALKEGTDYKITGYANNVGAGTATATIAGMGNFSGTRTVKFTIKAAPISKASMSAVDRVFTGQPLKPALAAATFGGAKLKAGADYKVTGYKNNTNVGTSTITVAGMGNFTGTRDVTFKITPAKLSADFFAIPSATFTGKALTPDPSSAAMGKVTLVKGTDFTVSYSSNINAGSALATIAGKGNFIGSVEVPFQIAKAQISKASMAITDQTYTGKALTPKLKTAVFNGVVLKEGVDYKITGYANNVGAGTATATVAGMGNFTGTRTVNFTIKAAIPAHYNGWVQSGSKWYWYQNGVKQGTRGRGCEIFDGKAWYWLDAVQGGARTINKDVFIPYFYSNDSMNASNQKGNSAFGKWVHYDGNGQMLKGWKKVNNKQYYFDPMTGEMAHGRCALPSSGKKISVFDNATGVYKGSDNNLNWDYWYENGAKQGVQGRGKEIVDPRVDKWFWLDSLYNGKKAVNKEVMMPYTYNGRDHTQKWVRYDANGSMIKGWFSTGGRTYYYDKITGAMYKGNHTIDGKRYYFDANTGVRR